MFCRVAAWGIAAFLFVSPSASSGETNAFADANAPAAAAAIATTHDRAEDQPQNQSQDQAHEDADAPTKVAALDPAEPPISSPAVPEPFGLSAIPVSSGEIVTKWSGVEAEIGAESEILARCRDSAEHCPRVAQKFLAIIAEGRARSGRARIGTINRAINLAIRPMSDLAQWGVPDRWSAPLDTLTTGRGDCEDYAIAKYVALTEAGVAAADVRLVIVRDPVAGEDHAVVAVRLDGDWIILDNRRLTLLEDTAMRRLVPLFALDQTGVKMFWRATPPRDAVAAPASVGF